MQCFFMIDRSWARSRFIVHRLDVRRSFQMRSLKSLGRPGERVPCFTHRGKAVGRFPSHGAIDHAGELRWERRSEVAEGPAGEGSQEVVTFRHIRKRRIAAGEVVQYGAPGKDVVGWTRRMPFILLA